MDWLFPSYTVHLTRSVDVPAERVLSVLHDPDQFFRLSPLIVRVEADPQEPTNPLSKLLTERLPTLGSYTREITIHGRMRILENGVVGEADAPGGTRVEAVYEVCSQDGDSSSCLIKERCTVQGFAPMMPYITRMMTTTQEAVLERLAARSVS